MAEHQEVVKAFEDMMEEVKQLRQVEMYFLAREVGLWVAYKLAYGKEPPLIDGLYEYQEEEFPAIKQKCDGLGEPNEILRKYTNEFCNSLKQKGYAYVFTTSGNEYLN
jgi:hypothetical protein